MVQAPTTKEMEANNDKEAKTEVTESTKTISQDELKSLLDDNNKKIAESLEQQKKDLEKLLKITKEARVEEIQRIEEQTTQIDPFELYRLEKQNERDKYLIDQMSDINRIEARLAGKRELNEQDKNLIAHHQETILLKQLDNVLNLINTNSKSIYTPLKEQLETLREDLANFNYVKIFMDYMENNKRHKEQISKYINSSEVDINFQQKNLSYERHYNYLLNRIYK